MNLGSFYFFSYADIFSLNNAKSFIIQLDGQELHLQREEMQTRGGTQMTFVGKTDQGNRKIFVLIDRSPKDALSTKTFLGNMIISPVKKDANITISDLMRERSAKTMNFSCSF